MLRLPEFKYFQPRSLKQAARALADVGADAMLVAGGTDVYPKMKRGQFTPRNLISLKLLRELTLFTIAVAGVPGLYAEEALWTCQTAFESP